MAEPNTRKTFGILLSRFAWQFASGPDINNVNPVGCPGAAN